MLTSHKLTHIPMLTFWNDPKRLENTTWVFYIRIFWCNDDTACDIVVAEFRALWTWALHATTMISGATPFPPKKPNNTGVRCHPFLAMGAKSGWRSEKPISKMCHAKRPLIKRRRVGSKGIEDSVKMNPCQHWCKIRTLWGHGTKHPPSTTPSPRSHEPLPGHKGEECIQCCVL